VRRQLRVGQGCWRARRAARCASSRAARCAGSRSYRSTGAGLCGPVSQ
jgi:hypothetical protein